MQLRDTHESYGLVSRLLHWLTAFAIVALFALGYWMVGLDYYSPYYHTAPDLHKAAGMIVFAALAARFVWRIANEKPDDSDLAPIEQKASRMVHWGFYPLLLIVMLSGYFISTGDGRSIDIFGLVSVPSLYEQKGIEDIAGTVHWIAAYVVMAVAALHTAGALKHHFIDRKPTLVRMWSGRSQR